MSAGISALTFPHNTHGAPYNLPMMTNAENKPRLDLSREARLRIAGTSMTDPRTVDRYCAGQPTRGLIQLRIEDAMRKLGIPNKPQAATVPADAA